MNTPEDAPEETIKGINAADLLARGLESAKAATGNPQAWHPPTPEELAALLPQYEIESLLGRGGMGAVYRGKQAALDRAVAIKLLPAELAADEEFLTRFQREARTLAKLQHPGIVAVHDFGQTSQGHLYFVMEFVSGTDLARLIHGPGVNSAQALEIIAQVCEALQYAHSQGVIHRDIKPANVLINQDGRAKLADFGLARPSSEETASLTRSNVVMGTPDYMAPEQMTGHADHRADLYALGVMLYEMLTGQTPRGAWAPPSQRVQVDVRLDQVVVRALQQDPAMRYQQASEIKTDVDVIRTTPLPKAGKGKKQPGPEAPGQRTTPLPKTKKPLNRFALAAVIVLPLLALAWWMMPKPETPTTTQGTPTASSSILWKALPMDSKLAAEAAANEGWVKPFRLYPSGVGKFTDGAVRLKYRWVEGAQLWLDLRSADQSKVELKLNTDGQASLILWQNGKGDTKKSLLLPWLKDGDEGTLELVVGGKTAHAKINDQALILEELPQPWEGILTIGAADSQKAPAIKDVEYAILDGIVDSLKTLGWEVPQAPAPSSTPWHKLGFFGGHQDPELIRPDEDGWIRTGKGNLHVTAAEQPGKRFIAGDTALRFRLLWTEENIGGQFGLWFRKTTKPTQPDGEVNLMVFKDRLVISERDRQLPLGTPGPTLREMTFSQPFKAGDEALLEVIGIGNTVYARVNGQQTQVTTSNLRPQGWITLGGWDACFKDAEYLHLDGLPDPLKALRWKVESVASGPAAATKETPFANSLGMKFVPVPITGGPTNGQRVLFSVWETRVRDFEAFVEESRRSWSKVPGLDQGPDHAVICVNWDDAQAFCAWLTARERNAGRLGAAQVYRLPSDHEWSCAVGIGDREDAEKLPQEKNLKLAGVFPWGNDWPPPGNSGNYSGEELRPLLAEGKYGYVKGEVPGYRDGQVTVGPVGGYAANGLGLHDLGGNAWEWCEDWYDKTQKERVLRGASWHNHDSGSLLSSHRWRISPDNRGFSQGGFRCVLAEVSPDQAKTSVLWQNAVWSDKDLPNVSADGWFSVGDELGWSDLHGLSGQVKKLIKLRDGAVRAQVRMGATPHKFKPSVGLWLRLPMDQSVSFGITETELIASRELGRIIFDTPFRPGDIERIEAAAVGDTFIVRFKGKELCVECPEAGRGGPVTFHGRNYGIKDVEYAILDGLPDPWKALGWEVPTISAGQTSASASRSGSPVVDEVVAWVFKNKGDVVISQRGKRVRARSLDLIQPGRFDLTEVHLPGDHVTDVEFARLGSLRGLRKIELTGVSHITSLKPLAGLTELQALWLPGNQGLAEEELAHLTGMTHLGSLRLRLTGATGEGFRHLQRLPKLQLLSLHDAEFTEEGAKAIAGIAELDWLLLNGCVHGENQKSLAAIARMPKLTSLDIDGTLTAEGFAALAPLKLTKLNLSSCKLDNAGFPLLTGSRGTLTELVMAWGATVSDEGIRHIVANFPNIERISASTGSTCTGASLRELARLPNLKRISWWVKGMKTADYVLLADLPMIEGIGVGFGTDITDEALPAFAKCQHLKELHLAETAITDAGLKALQNIRPLKTVNLEKTKITPAGLAEFQKARPDVHVTHNIDAAPAGAALPSK